MSTTVSPAAHDAALAVARPTLEAIVADTATKPGYVVLGLPGSGYALHLRPVAGARADGAGPLAGKVGKRVSGVMTVRSRRVDVVQTGGRFVEPLVGRPRRVQGTVLARDSAANTLTVNAASAAAVDGPSLPIVLALTDPRQRAEAFEIGALVGCDVHDGGTFEPR